MRLGVACEDEEAGRVAVEAVDDSRPVGVLSTGRPPEERVDERAAPPAGTRVDDDAGGLVDDQQVLVLVGDREGHVLALERRLRRLRLELELVAGGEPVALRPRRAADRDLAALDQPFRDRARADLGGVGEEAVEPRPRRVVRDAEPDGQDGQPPPASPRARRHRRR